MATINPAFQSGGADIAPVQPGQNLGSATTLGANTTNTSVNPNASMQTQGLNAPLNSPVQSAPVQSAPTQTVTPTAQTLNPSDPSLVNALNATGQKSDFASRANLASQYGISNYTGTADQNTQLLQKYRSALSNVQSSNQTAPTTSGEANSQIQDMMSKSGQSAQDMQQQQAGLEAIKTINEKMTNDPGLQQLMQDQKDYLSSVNQQQTLAQQFTDLTNQLGIPALNAQLINMKSVMDGSETDIRNEITKAGGFATESQVLALTSARNKTMIQNYNNLLQTRDDAINQIKTTMGFAQQDQANATALAQEKMNYDKQIIEYEQKMTDNAKSAYQKIIDTPGYGYKALYASTGGDAHTISMIENTLGLSQGGLQQLAQQTPDAKTQVVKLDNGNTVLINSQTGQTIKTLGGANPTGGTDSGSGLSTTGQAWVTAVLNGNATMAQVPSSIRNEVAVGLTNQPITAYSPLAGSRLANEANKIIANYKDLPAYQLTAGGQIYLGRINAAIQTPGSVSDQDLLDSLTKLNTGGNAVTDAQVKLITDGKSFSDMVSTAQNKFANGGVLSNTQRTQLQTIAKAIFDSYKKQYQPIYDKAVAQMDAAGIPKAFQNLPDLNNLSAQGLNNENNPQSLPPEIDTALQNNSKVDDNAKTVTIPKSVWSTFGTNMDAVLAAVKSKGYQLLVGN